MPPEAQSWDTAVLQTAGPNGCEIVNYRVNGDTWTIDRLFTSAELVSGTGKRAMRLSIFREGVHGSGLWKEEMICTWEFCQQPFWRSRRDFRPRGICSLGCFHLKRTTANKRLNQARLNYGAFVNTYRCGTTVHMS